MTIIAVLEPEKDKRDIISNFLFMYSLKKNLDIKTYLLTDHNSLNRLTDIAQLSNIAMISSSWNSYQNVGKSLYNLNPDCRIIYYSSENIALKPLLNSRPIGYHCILEGQNEFEVLLDSVFSEIENSTGIFHWSTRRRTVFIPTRRIIYFKSDLKTVVICLKEGEEVLVAKLSEVEKLLSNRFVRIHQSFLVNGNHIRQLNKSNRTVLMSNGDILPLSDAKYDSAVCKIENCFKEESYND